MFLSKEYNLSERLRKHRFLAVQRVWGFKSVKTTAFRPVFESELAKSINYNLMISY